MSLFVETEKPSSLSEATQTLYYLSGNRHPSGGGYTEITNDEVLEIAYKVYYKLQDDVNKL